MPREKINVDYYFPYLYRLESGKEHYRAIFRMYWNRKVGTRWYNRESRKVRRLRYIRLRNYGRFNHDELPF